MTLAIALAALVMASSGLILLVVSGLLREPRTSEPSAIDDQFDALIAASGLEFPWPLTNPADQA